MVRNLLRKVVEAQTAVSKSNHVYFTLSAKVLLSSAYHLNNLSLPRMRSGLPKVKQPYTLLHAAYRFAVASGHLEARPTPTNTLLNRQHSHLPSIVACFKCRIYPQKQFSELTTFFAFLLDGLHYRKPHLLRHRLHNPACQKFLW